MYLRCLFLAFLSFLLFNIATSTEVNRNGQRTGAFAGGFLFSGLGLGELFVGWIELDELRVNSETFHSVVFGCDSS